MEFQVRPLNDRVLIQRTAAETVTKGGLIIPDAHQEKPVEGTVLAVGPGKLLKNGDRYPVGVAVGEKVCFGKHAGHDTRLLDDQLIMSEDEILGVVEE